MPIRIADDHEAISARLAEIQRDRQLARTPLTEEGLEGAVAQLKPAMIRFVVSSTTRLNSTAAQVYLVNVISSSPLVVQDCLRCGVTIAYAGAPAPPARYLYYIPVHKSHPDRAHAFCSSCHNFICSAPLNVNKPGTHLIERWGAHIAQMYDAGHFTRSTPPAVPDVLPTLSPSTP